MTTRLSRYLDWRLGVVAFVTVVFALLLLVGLVLLVSADADNIGRFGILLQFLGGLALVPDVFGRDLFLRAAREPEAGEPDLDFLQAYEQRNLPILSGNIATAVLLGGLLVVSVAFPDWLAAVAYAGEFLPGAMILGVLAILWLNLLMMLYVYRLMGSDAPGGLTRWFGAFDLLMSILGLPFAALFYAWLVWLPRGLRFVFRNGVRRVLLVITLPFVLVGLVFELIATF